MPARPVLIFVASGCFDRYKIIYSRQGEQVIFEGLFLDRFLSDLRAQRKGKKDSTSSKSHANLSHESIRG